MRIISGKHKGKVLAAFKGEKIRPTSDRAKSALFNIFQFRIRGCSFYDAFSGSGNMGIEALSRGAKLVVLTDISDESISLIKKNLSLIKENAIVEKINALDYLKRTSQTFDFIFIDPPYSSNDGIRALEIIAKRKLLNENGVAIFENESNDNRVIDGLVKIDSRNYGIANFDMYEVSK